MTSTETMLILAALTLLLLGLAALLFRKAAPDPALMQAMAALHSAQERLGTALAAIPGDMRAEMAERFAAQSREISGFSVEQGKLLTAQEKAVLERLATDAATTAKSLAENRAEATAAATALQALLTAADAVQAEKLAEAMAVLRRDQGAANAETKQTLEAVKTTLAEGAVKQAASLATETGRTRDLLDLRLKELREGNEQKLAEIQKSVNEQLQSAVEKQMNESFSRVIDQFAAVQKAMGDVQAVTGQIGDIKRLFSNVKTRGGWGETQVRALLDDILPAGAYEMNKKLSEDSGEAVEFAVLMPSETDRKIYLAIDAKFPTEDWDRLVIAGEAGDVEAERIARRALEQRVRAEAGKIAGKYIRPPLTVEFAVLYLPTEGIYAEIARIPGAIEDMHRQNRVLVLGPSLLPAMLSMIRMGHVTIALGEKADMVRELLGATKAEMGRMDEVLGRLRKQATAFGNTIDAAQVRTRQVARKLKSVDAVASERVELLLDLSAEAADPDETEAD